MLQLMDGRVVESVGAMSVSGGNGGNVPPFVNTAGTASGGGGGGGGGTIPSGSYYQTVWMGYPVYVCSDKTAKAIEILKTLQKEKKIRCDSVPKFIELVEKIASIL